MPQPSMRKLRIYVAGPYSGKEITNMGQAIRAADQLMNLGFSPYVPHYTGIHDLVCPRPYEFWLQHDFDWIPLCDALYRMPGKSSGADGEVAFCIERHIPVFFNKAELYTFKEIIHADYPHLITGTSQGLEDQRFMLPVWQHNECKEITARAKLEARRT